MQQNIVVGAKQRSFKRIKYVVIKVLKNAQVTIEKYNKKKVLPLLKIVLAAILENGCGEQI